MAKATMKDVAARAGVDTSTVSRALGDDTRKMLSAGTVERVVAAAAELGYRPNTLARGLRTQRTGIIGMLVPDITNPFFPPVVRGLEDELQARGYTLIVTNTDNDEERETSALRTLLDRQVDGLVLATSHLDGSAATTPDLHALPPTVLVNRRGAGEPLSSVVPHDESAVRAVVRHLHDLGHRQVAHVAGPQILSTGRDRLRAFVEACTEVGIEAPPVEIADTFAIAAGVAACHRLMARSEPFSALFAANDLLAIGGLQELRRAGRDVPGDVSLVGYNDLMLVDLIDPPLTTIHVPQYDMGREAARMLLAELRGDKGVRGRSLQLPCALVVRASTAPPAG